MRRGLVVLAVSLLGANSGCRADPPSSQGSASRSDTTTHQTQAAEPSRPTGSVTIGSLASSIPPQDRSETSSEAVPIEDAEFAFPKTMEGKRAAFVMFLHGLGGSGPQARRALS